MRRFLVLLKKELRELVTLQMLLPFVVVIAMFSLLGQTLATVGGDGTEASPLTVYDADASPASALVIESLREAGFDVRPGTGGDPASTAASLDRSGGSIVVEVPAGFGAALESGAPLPVRTWTVVRSFSFLSNQDLSKLTVALETANSAIAAELAGQAAPSVPVEVLRNPVRAEEHVVVGGREAQASVATVMAFVSQQTTFIPIVLFVVIIFAAQMIAVAIATEKENKTLETLLSYPVSRASIVTSKMVAAGLVALVSAGAYMLGMQQYMKGIESGLETGGASERAAQASEAVMQQLGLTFGPLDYVLLGLTLFAGILVALSIAIILGAFAENVKSVQSLLTPLMVLLLVPYFLTLFLDLSALPEAARLAVMAIPFTYPFIAGPSLFLGDFAVVWFGIGYQLVWFAVFVAIAARVFSSDRILTMKLRLGKRR